MKKTRSDGFFRLGFAVTIAALILVLPVVASSVGPTVQPKAPDCAYTAQKGADGRMQYVLNGPGCPGVAAAVKQQAGQTKVYGGGDCEGDCHCTWDDNCGQRGCFICRGCCREILTKLTR